MISQADSVIFDFTNNQNLDSWHIVNDDVMGGLSKGKMSITEKGSALFTGFISIENSGGFSSVKHAFTKKEVSNYLAVVLLVKGDGKAYQFRIKESLEQQHSYVHQFKTTGAWETISIPFDSFYPSFRGDTLKMPNYNGEFMEEVTFMMGNKREESFVLEIERIWLE